MDVLYTIFILSNFYIHLKLFPSEIYRKSYIIYIIKFLKKSSTMCSLAVSLVKK